MVYDAKDRVEVITFAHENATTVYTTHVSICRTNAGQTGDTCLTFFHLTPFVLSSVSAYSKQFA